MGRPREWGWANASAVSPDDLLNDIDDAGKALRTTLITLNTTNALIVSLRPEHDYRGDLLVAAARLKAPLQSEASKGQRYPRYIRAVPPDSEVHCSQGHNSPDYTCELKNDWPAAVHVLLNDLPKESADCKALFNILFTSTEENFIGSSVPVIEHAAIVYISISPRSRGRIEEDRSSQTLIPVCTASPAAPFSSPTSETGQSSHLYLDRTKPPFLPKTPASNPSCR